MVSLIDKIRAGRRFSVKVNHMTFTGERPTVEKFADMYNQGKTDCEMVRLAIDGWSGVKEKDIIKGGSNDIVDFDAELWAVVIGDMPHVWSKIAGVIADGITACSEKSEAARKN